MHQHRHPDLCDICEMWSPTTLQIVAHLNRIEDILERQQQHFDRRVDQLRRLIVTEAQSNQDHMDQDEARLETAIGTAVAELKAQIANGATPEQLDFTKLDALATSTEAEAAADAPAPPAG